MNATTTALTQATRDFVRHVTRLSNNDELIAKLRAEVAEAKEAVTSALEGDADFDEASKAFRQANNKLDRAIETQENGTAITQSLSKAVSDALQDVNYVALNTGK